MAKPPKKFEFAGVVSSGSALSKSFSRAPVSDLTEKDFDKGVAVEQKSVGSFEVREDIKEEENESPIVSSASQKLAQLQKETHVPQQNIAEAYQTPLQAMDSLQDLFKHDSPALKELQFKILHKKKLEEVMNRVLATRNASLHGPSSFTRRSNVARRRAECFKTPVFFDDLGSVHQVDYLLDKTSSLISVTERALRPSYQSTCAYFASDLLLVHKLVNLYTMSTQNQGQALHEMGKAPLKIPQRVVSSCIDLVAKFRRIALRADCLIFDLSQNSFSDEYMVKASQLIKLCSINLQVIKLDGNYLSHQTLQLLGSTLSQQTGGANSLQVLSMSDCGIEETDAENPFQIKALFEIIASFAESLVSIDLSKNSFGPYFISHLPRVPNLTTFAVRGCFQTQDDLLSLVDRLAKQALPIDPLVDLLDPTQCMVLSPGLRQLFEKLRTGNSSTESLESEPRALILNQRFQIVQKDPVQTNHFFRRVISEQQVPPNYTVIDLKTNQRFFMLLRPQEESTEIETYLNPLFTSHPDIFLQPVSLQSFTSQPETTDPGAQASYPDLEYLVNTDTAAHHTYELRQVRLYEGFICTLDQVRLYKDQSQLINMEQLAILLIDFCERVSRYEQIRDYFVMHSSQLVLIRNAQECKYEIKMVPFEQNSFSKATQLMVQTELARKTINSSSLVAEGVQGGVGTLSEEQDELETFLFENCMNVQEQIYPLVRYWQHLFRHNVVSEEHMNVDALTEFEQQFKRATGKSKIFSVANLNKILLILTVMDDFFNVDVAGILAKVSNKKLERLKQQIKQSSASFQQSLRSSSSAQLRAQSKKEEIKYFFDALFGSLGSKLSKSVDMVEKTLLTDFVYAKVRKLALQSTSTTNFNFH